MVEFSDLLNKKEIIMKNAVILIIFAIAIVCTAEQYIIPYSTENVTIDGSIDQLEWQDALHIPMHSENMYIVFDEPNDVADLSGDIYVKWDEQYLYIAARVYDDNLQWLQNSPGPFNYQDAFQVCLNPGQNPSATIFVDAPIYDIVPQDAGGNGPGLYKHSGNYMSLPSALVGGQIYSDGYGLEVAMPWSELDISPLPGQPHGIGFILVDYDESQGGAADTLMKDFDGSIGVPSNWNTAILVTEDGCGINGMLPADFNWDCSVNLTDWAIFAGEWLVCTDPDIEGCIDAR